EVLVEVEGQGFTVIPSAKATRLTMNREGIRRLVAEELRLPTSPYRFADSEAELRSAAEDLGFPCVVKPVMSSSGKGQSLVRKQGDIPSAWGYSQSGGRAGSGRIIVEGYIDFDYEITLLTVRHRDGTSFCEPIGHLQVDGDYRESWQPQAMTAIAFERAQSLAARVTGALGGYGLFGVELFVQGEDVIFSEVSPRPHDTGMVTLISQDLSEFALHVRAILGLPIPVIRQRGPAASSVIMAEGRSKNIRYQGLEEALAQPDTALRLFGKPEVNGRRRLGVALALADSVEQARASARQSAAGVKIAL
ncbi:MAG: formate-dependent phosphoribosylglycinamide formyltransferase, partial [Gammaproteobacteria bacterium]